MKCFQKVEPNFAESRDDKNEQVAIRYRGQKNNYLNGANAHRVDVLFKTLIRSLRRYLNEKLTQEYTLPKPKSKSSSANYTECLTKFYAKDFKPFADAEGCIGADEERTLILYLG